MRMRGFDICKVWSRVPGLNDYWCQQIQWRISKDDELIGALTEPRYPCPDLSLDTIVLTQTVYLCQLFLHLQEFDPCAATDTTIDDPVVNDELLTVFQDSLAREFNFAYTPHNSHDRHHHHHHQGPAPVGEALERLVRGLMLAQRQDPPPRPSTAPMPPPATSSEADRAHLHAVLIRILRELNEPVDKKPIRYAQAYGPRTPSTWAARFATRVMQWRWTVRYQPGNLIDEVIEVQRHDVYPLDEEGLEVYRILRCTAPGLIHLVTPLRPETTSQPGSAAAPIEVMPSPTAASHSQQGRPGSSGMKVQQMLGTPLEQTPGTSHSEGGDDTPRTTPPFPQPSMDVDAESSTASVKRGSEDLGSTTTRPSKRSRPAESIKETGSTSAAEGTGSDVAKAARAAMAMADMTGELSIRSGPMDIDDAPKKPLPPPTLIPAAPAPAPAPTPATASAVEESNALLRRTVEGVAELGRKMDTMQATMNSQLRGLDEKLNRMLEWVGSED